MIKLKRSITALSLILVLLPFDFTLNAQEGTKGRQVKTNSLVSVTDPATPMIAFGDGGGFSVVSSFGFNERMVKGMPMSAQAVTETVQVLTDGNKITRKTTVMLYRDSQGRTRREQTLATIGPLAINGEPPQIIFISDPVSGVSYSLDQRNRTAHKFAIPKHTIEDQKNIGRLKTKIDNRVVKAQGGGGGDVILPAPVNSQSAVIVSRGAGLSVGADMALLGNDKPSVSKEDLGKQVIEGVEAEGTKHTITIEAGLIGNELPITTVTETWYSRELGQTLYSKTTDPRFGETSYRLTNISRAEPDHTLFEVPADYTFKESMRPEFKIGPEPNVHRFKIEKQPQ